MGWPAQPAPPCQVALGNSRGGNKRTLFLKFVTSSSRPPLLGFASIHAQFTIRCVENNEEDGIIYDTSFRKFFKAILNIENEKETVRLPTSSTCFCLLKFPDYFRKITLRERLGYAITSDSSFELSSVRACLRLLVEFFLFLSACCYCTNLFSWFQNNVIILFVF